MIPVLKVNNRFLNVDFYTNILGFKVLHEENAFADLGSHGEKKPQLILEESPAARSRKVKGLKKLAQITVKVAIPDEIELLLGLGAPYQTLYQGPKGWAFTALSPEGDLFLLHAEDQVSDLKVFEGEPSFQKVVTEFAGLSHFEIETISVHTTDAPASQNLISELLPESNVVFIQAEGEDLQVANTVTWDLVGFEAKVSKDQSLGTMAEFARQKELPVFLDKKERFVVVTDHNGLDLTLRK